MLKQFTYVCCGNSLDATIDLVMKNDLTLHGNNTASGAHLWNIYTAPNVNTGPYLAIGSYNSPAFSINTGASCFYVTHEISNGCGRKCAAQTICGINCLESMDCVLSKPKDLNFDKNTLEFTWSGTGATSYIIQLIIDDPACCGGPLVL